jgi:hypothetical protein
VDFTLAVGQSTRTIEVSATGKLLATEGATVGTVIEEERITELPAERPELFQSGSTQSGRELQLKRKCARGRRTASNWDG